MKCLRVNWYYLHFRDPVDLSAVSGAFSAGAEEMEIKPLYPGSYELFSATPFNVVKYSLAQAFPGSDFYICKVKAGFIHVPD